jgi:hypothetical protein
MKVIIAGVTGMVGEGVLFECLENSNVGEILIVNRRHYDRRHPKLKELILTDFSRLNEHFEQLKDYDACFYCAGVSSVGASEEEFTKATYDVVVPFATTLSQANPDMVFNFVSGARTDSSETGKVMWARVKGKTENALMRLPFRRVYNFRPAIMKAFKRQLNVKTIYKIMAPVVSIFYPQKTLSLKQVGQAMTNTVLKGYPKQILEVNDIEQLAKQ